jgi:hypothetical protein
MTNPATTIEPQLDPEPTGHLEPLPNASRTSDYPVREEARTMMAALYERVLLAHGALVMAEEDSRLAEEGTAAGYDSLPPA